LILTVRRLSNKRNFDVGVVSKRFMRLLAHAPDARTGGVARSTLGAAALVALAVWALLSGRKLSLPQVFACSAIWVALQFVAAIIAIRLGSRTWNQETLDETTTLKLALAAVWFAPLAITLARGSLWLIAATAGSAMVLAMVLAVLPTATSERGHFINAVCLQLSVLAAWTGNGFAASVLVGFAMYRVTRAAAPEWSTSRISVALGLAVILTAVGLLPLMRPKVNVAAAVGNAPPGDPNMFSGIVLKPPRPPHVTLVAPPAREPVRAGRSMAKPLRIPFSGEYWVYYDPLQRPPESSLVESGDPTDFKFTASGFTKLNMEARQTISAPIDVNCCSAIDVSIVSTERMPGTVWLELFIGDSLAPQDRGQSLGMVEARSNGVLRFAMRRNGRVRHFDQLTVVYRLQLPRMNRSAHVAVDAFALIP
jgi:hypothetical protein